MTEAWRHRRGGELPADEEPAPKEFPLGWRDRLGMRPYHRNPAHMLLARPGVIAVLIITLALVLRVVEVQRASYTPTGDANAYLVLGGQIASSGDYSSFQRGPAGTKPGPTAYFAPAYPYLLGALDFIDGNAPTSHSAVHVARLSGAVIGAIIVGLIGLIALELFGVDMALLAMALAAIYPVMIETSSVVMAENLLVAFELGAVWAALRVHRSGDPLRWTVATGILTGLAALTHPDAILMLIPLAVGVSGAVPVFGRREVGSVAVLVACTLLTLTPWLLRDGLVMHRFVPITDASGTTLAGTYNPTSPHSDPAYRPLDYRQVPALADVARRAGNLSETQLSSRLDSRAFTYVVNHPVAPVAAALHNTLRLLELEGPHAWKASAATIGISTGTAEIGVICFWALCALALLGMAAPPGLRAPGWVWAVPVVMWLTVVLVNAETPRFRSVIEPFLILLAARGIARLARWMRPARAASMTAVQSG